MLALQPLRRDPARELVGNLARGGGCNNSVVQQNRIEATAGNRENELLGSIGFIAP
jgi:hypothetical protein